MISKEEAVEIVKEHVLDSISRNFHVSSIEDGMPENCNIYGKDKMSKEEVWYITYSLLGPCPIDGGCVAVISKKTGKVLYSGPEGV